MSKDELSFQKVARPLREAGLAGVWSAPQQVLDLGGNLAVWAEHGTSSKLLDSKQQIPWLVLHGGPGGSLGTAQVAPIRFAGLPWFGFDQRNSGLSEDLDLSSIDLQRFVDDALEVADRLSIPKFHILGGSWGGTLALAIAAYRPDQVASVVLRAPFLPMRPRVDAFFESLERIAPDYFAEYFGPGARTDFVCGCLEVATPEHLVELSVAWNKLEVALLSSKSGGFDVKRPFLNDVQELALVRKYRLQAHFLRHDCFLSPKDLHSLFSTIAQASWPLSIIQGLDDKVCPPGGSKLLSEIVLRSSLIELPNTGHLADSGDMLKALSQEVTRHHLMV